AAFQQVYSGISNDGFFCRATIDAAVAQPAVEGCSANQPIAGECNHIIPIAAQDHWLGAIVVIVGPIKAIVPVASIPMHSEPGDKIIAAASICNAIVVCVEESIDGVVAVTTITSSLADDRDQIIPRVAIQCADA